MVIGRLLTSVQSMSRGCGSTVMQIDLTRRRDLNRSIKREPCFNTMTTGNVSLFTMKPPTSSSSSLQSIVRDYAARLRQSVHEDGIIHEFRERFNHRFQDLCMVHLSFLIEIPWHLFDQRSAVHSTQESTPKSALKRLLAGAKVTPQQQLKTDTIPPHLADNVIYLIDRLDTDEACSTEGIFRKAGHMLRKRQLHEAVVQTSFQSDCFPWDAYSTHDVAAALKSTLSHLPSLLLTERLMPLFLRVAGLRKSTDSATDYRSKQDQWAPGDVAAKEASEHACLMESKQLKALRLLIQLLPAVNKRIVHRLLQLLTRIVRLQKHSRMNSSCLGTVFGPVLFTDGMGDYLQSNCKFYRPVTEDYHELYKQVATLSTVFVEAGSDIFQLPRSLAEDVHSNCADLPEFIMSQERLKSMPNSTTHNSVKLSSDRHAAVCSPSVVPIDSFATEEGSPPPLRTGIRFATSTLNSTLTCTPGSTKSCLASPFAVTPVIQSPMRSGCSSPVPASPQPRSPIFSGPPVVPMAQRGQYPPRMTLQSPVTHSPLFAHPDMRKSSKLSRRNSFTVFQVKNLKQIESTVVNPVEKPVSNPIVDSPAEFKVNKRRRYTELRFPHAIQRNNGGPKKHIFSPCPPLRFLPFRRIIPEKRAPHTTNGMGPGLVQNPPVTPC